MDISGLILYVPLATMFISVATMTALCYHRSLGTTIKAWLIVIGLILVLGTLINVQHHTILLERNSNFNYLAHLP